jgi:high-affinity Fe2+/Pb2+ permease
MTFAINWLGVIVAVIASWLVGAVWYMLLSKQWLAAIGKTAEQINSKDPTPYIIGFVCQLVMGIVLAGIMPALFGATSAVNGLLTGGLMWLGFVITAMILNHRYEGAPWSRTFIDGGYLLVALLVQGMVIGLFGGGAPAA